MADDVPYTVVVHLGPPDMQMDEWAEITQAAYGPRQSVVWSADDAARLVAPGQPGSRVIAWWPERWGGDIITWLKDRGVEQVDVVPTEPPPPPPPPPPTIPFALTVWPTTHRYITQHFAANPQNYEQYGLPGHEGTDIRAPLDSPIKAAAAGLVSVAGWHQNYGYHVRVNHGMPVRYQMVYAHLRDDIQVTVGAWVEPGQVLGYSGNTGNSFGAHLHFGLKRYPDGLEGWPYNFINPEPFLAAIPDV
jgi:murein DD-endopeptidase MepM/ murein hydrolase activator NlpD